MNTKPLVTVLVTTYNQETYIGETLDSLLMQVCAFDYEILIGEDCSTDSTRAICLKYAEQHPDRIRLILNETNKGFINNYFDLVDEARGLYLADCGGDDFWLSPDKLSLQVNLLEQYPEVTMVCSNWQLYHQNSKKLETNKTGKSEDWYRADYFGLEAVRDYLNERDFPRIVLSTACFRTDQIKELLQNNRSLFRADSVVCEDLPITLCLLMKGPFYLMKEELMRYRVLEKSFSHSDNLQHFSYPVFLQTLDLALALGLNVGDLEPYLKKALPHLIFSAYLTRDKDWMQQIGRDLQKYRIKWSLKQQIQRLATLCPALYCPVHLIYRFCKKDDLCTK